LGVLTLKIAEAIIDFSKQFIDSRRFDSASSVSRVSRVTGGATHIVGPIGPVGPVGLLGVGATRVLVAVIVRCAQHDLRGSGVSNSTFTLDPEPIVWVDPELSYRA